MPYVYVPDHPVSVSSPEYYRKEPHPDNLERALKLLDKLEKKRLKAEKETKDKKKNTKEKWIPNPDYDDKARTFTVGELTAVVMVACFPIAVGQILLLQWITRLILPH